MSPPAVRVRPILRTSSADIPRRPGPAWSGASELLLGPAPADRLLGQLVAERGMRLAAVDTLPSMAVWDELRVILIRLRDEQPGVRESTELIRPQYPPPLPHLEWKEHRRSYLRRYRKIKSLPNVK